MDSRLWLFNHGGADWAVMSRPALSFLWTLHCRSCLTFPSLTRRSWNFPISSTPVERPQPSLRTFRATSCFNFRPELQTLELPWNLRTKNYFLMTCFKKRLLTRLLKQLLTYLFLLRFPYVNKASYHIKNEHCVPVYNVLHPGTVPVYNHFV